ncbi:hypothetical protein ElyMa_003972300 [Elysia marginata]|uniref:Uncharacterized protein n=1 Tax=Elysia marginata TaxID=1093978 RepID=A0AAV4FVY3_9GAST|nr:hypothetical protein ElyMa_003972300 [Elysia marginata]
MAAFRGKIQNLFETLDSRDSKSNSIEILYHKTFLVLEVSRYYPNPRSRSYYGFDRCQFWDLFDITLADGKHRRKFVISADNVRKLQVFTGSQIRLKLVERYWDNTENGQVAVLVIRDVEVTGEKSSKVPEKLLRLPLVPSIASPEEKEKPLASNRLYYMDNWTFNLAAGQTFGEVKHVALETVDLSAVRSIRDVTQSKSAWLERRHMLVRVMRKSRLIHYINQLKEEKWPFQLPLLVADSSGWCCAVAWNSLAVQLANYLQEGCVLLLKNVRVKPNSMQKNTKSFFNPPDDASVFPNELSLDIRNPKTEVALVDFTSDRGYDDLRLPQLELRLMSRTDLISVPDFTVVDVEGLVMFVSQVEREPRKARSQNAKDSGGFFYHRWIHLRSGDLENPIPVLIYSGDQLSTFNDLRPGQYALCRHVLSNQQLGDLTSSRQQRYQWLVTTTNSKIYIVDRSGEETLPDELKKELHLSPTKSPQGSSLLFLEGGTFRYPPYTKGADSLLSQDLFERLESYENRLTTWGECQRLTVIACLKSVRYVDLTEKLSGGLQQRTLRSRKRKARREETVIPVPQEDGITEQTAQDVIQLWPTSKNGSSLSTARTKQSKAAVQLDWYEKEPIHHFTTWKPCAFSLGENQDSHTQLDNLQSFLKGQYDCDLGLVGCSRSYLTDEEACNLTQTAAPICGREFVLLIDAYTNKRNQKLFVVDRAFCVT